MEIGTNLNHQVDVQLLVRPIGGRTKPGKEPDSLALRLRPIQPPPLRAAPRMIRAAGPGRAARDTTEELPIDDHPGFVQMEDARVRDALMPGLHAASVIRLLLGNVLIQEAEPPNRGAPLHQKGAGT